MSVSLKDKLYENSDSVSVESIEKTASIAEKYGYSIYLIGGIVRDIILGTPLKDIDITTECDAIEFSKILERTGDCKIISVQENLRTAKVLFHNGIEIDFASTREEIYTGSGILPVACNFGCKLEIDIKRRDFTINTLAIALTGNNKYNLVDFSGGYDDILNRKIKILHDKSFIDDPSRIIRALKFKERFEFELDEKTEFLMKKYLDNPSKTMPLERIKGELKQYFSINKKGLYERFVKSGAYTLLSDSPYKGSVDTYLTEAEKYIKTDDITFIYFLLLIIDSDYDLQRLNLSKTEKKALKEVRELLKKDFNDKKEIYDSFKSCENASLTVYYIIRHDNPIKIYFNELKDIKPEVTGNDLINLGFVPSSKFAEVFDKITEAKTDGKIKNKTEELEFAKRILNDL